LRKVAILVAFAAALTAGPALAEEKAEQPKEKKVCRTVQMSGRITPERVCRKVRVPAREDRNRRDGRAPASPAGQPS
jgi:hypothetical protein